MTLQADFVPHDLGPSERNLMLYHVYDKCSQTPYRRGAGIPAGSASLWPRPPPRPYARRITSKAVHKHLTWAGHRETTPFISLWGDGEAAKREAARRQQDAWPGHADVHIAVVSAFQLSRIGVFYFSREDLCSERMRRIGQKPAVAPHMDADLWLAVDWIPEAAIIGIIPARRLL